jgi:NAD(P)H-hydrate repair Nnr-like enzyme with NAD(P)H-hydrate dehydratase domain
MRLHKHAYLEGIPPDATMSNSGLFYGQDQTYFMRILIVQDADLDGIPDDMRHKAAKRSLEPISKWLEKSSCLVVGPGLGADPVMAEAARLALEEAREKVRYTSRFLCILQV